MCNGNPKLSLRNATAQSWSAPYDNKEFSGTRTEANSYKMQVNYEVTNSYKGDWVSSEKYCQIEVKDD